jgi:thiamine kinase-like enzyme
MDQLQIEPMPGGWTNDNYRVIAGDEIFVLRVSGAHSDALGIEREAERDAARAAEVRGLGAEIVRFLEPEGHLVTRFIPGRLFPWDAAPPLEDALRMLDVLQEVHSFPASRYIFSPFRMVERYLSRTRDAGGHLPDDAAELLARLRVLEKQNSGAPTCFCHNDASLGNFIAGEDGRMRLLDWEVAGMNDPLFDLATLIVGHMHDAQSEAEIVNAYVARRGRVDAARLEAMKFLYELREASWSLLHDTLVGDAGPLSAEFRDAADRFFAAARQRL